MDAQLQLAQAELGDARARIAELEDQLAAAASAAPAPAVAAETAPQKLPVLDEIHSSGGSETAAAALEPGVQEHAAARTNPFHALSDIGLDERAAQLVALAGAHGYAIVFGADCAEGEPSARSQLVENAAAAMTAAGVSVAVHKLDISGMAGGSAFVVFGDDDSQVRSRWLVCRCCVAGCCGLIDSCDADAWTICRQPAGAGCGGGSRPSDCDLAASRRQQRHTNSRKPQIRRLFTKHGSNCNRRRPRAAQRACHRGDRRGRKPPAPVLLGENMMAKSAE